MADAPELLQAILLSFTDERRAAVERELVPIVRAAALGELAADIGHDVANSLFAVLGLVDLLAEDAVPGSPAEARLQLIRETGLELRAGLSGLLDFARAGTAGGERAALDGAARAAVALLRHGKAKQLAVEERYPERPLLVACGPGSLVQAVLHLIAGARTVAGAAGEIDVEVARSAETEAVLRVSPAPPEGLGLVAARRIAEDHGGTLVRSDSAAVLRLPVA
jgi:signal transduction histidine kinase